MINLVFKINYFLKSRCFRLTLLFLFFGFLFPYNYAESKCSDNTLPLKNLKDYSFILVPGIFNEFIPFYMCLVYSELKLI